MDRHEVEVHKDKQTKKKTEREGRERERDQYSTILTEPKVDRTEPKLIYSSYSNTKSVLVELSRQSRGADKIGPA